MTISAAHRESLMKLMTNLHSTHPHFVRCIIPNECAQKALVAAGMDADSFRCGKTKIMFRAGMLSTLEEIREGALSKIFVKMQCQARRVLVHVTYQGKIAEKKGISSIQRNIRLYYNCRDWAWYQFYTMVKGEMAVLKKKLAEEERRKQMAEGLAKFQAILAQAAAEREAAQAANEAAVAKIAATKAE